MKRLLRIPFALLIAIAVFFLTFWYVLYSDVDSKGKDADYGL